MGFGASSTGGYVQWCNRTNIDIWGTGVGESLNKTKQLDEISASAKNYEYRNSQDIQNSHMKHHAYWQQFAKSGLL